MEEILPQKQSEWDRKVLCSFLNELQTHGLALPEQESLPRDIYWDIHGMDLAEIRAYLYKQVNQPKGYFNRLNLHAAYGHWLVIFIERSLYIHPMDKEYDPKGLASWIIKELGIGGADEYATTAYVNVLRKIWLNGGLGKEFKGHVKASLLEHGVGTTHYGCNKII